MASITQDVTIQDVIAPVRVQPAVRRKAHVAMIVADILALLGIIAVGISLFIRGWVHVQVVFATPGKAANVLLQSFGLDVNKEISQIAEREIGKSVPPTLWQFQGHDLQYAFALLIVVAVLLLAALFAPRLRVMAHALAVLACAGSVSLVLVAFLRLRDDSSALPARVGRAILNSSIANRVFDLTTGKPELTGTAGWPLYLAAAGLLVIVLGVLLGFIFAATRTHAMVG